MSGYSRTPLGQKLGIRAGHRVALVGAPSDFESTLAPLPPDVVLATTDDDAPADVQLVFAHSAAALEAQVDRRARTLPRGALLWIAWPKQASRVPTDLTGDVVRRIGLATGLVDVKVCAISDVWSGLKFVHRRPS